MNSPETSGPVRKATTSPGRADARRNHEQVVAAAVDLFREHGTLVTIPQIAAKAQVGKATVYRSFATKEHLIESITQLGLDELAQRTARARHEADPYEAFRVYVFELFDVLARDRLLAERLADAVSQTALPLLEPLVEIMETARATGKLREDATPLDLRVLLCGAALQLVRLEERDPVLWRRYAAMALRALCRCPH
ncbi:helix-turn-helix domain-containing protein [Streptomyces sp. NPDC006668]|uniref:TetR/AcrR family transcriptional regulator n=1 Tax=Streptomyces sp. NPDC006668 TaxID=3156903 RepID=UPI0033EB7033